jgi:hypothetical protein
MNTKIHVVIPLLFLALGMPGRHLNAQLAGSSPLRTQVESSTNPPPVTAPILFAWQQGDKSTAISNFLAADWTRRPLFSSNSILNLSEDQFRAKATGLDPNRSQALGTNMFAELNAFRKVTAAVTQAGTNAAALKDFPAARRHFVAVQRCGEALDSTNSLKIVQMVGSAIKKRAEKELQKLPE